MGSDVQQPKGLGLCITGSKGNIETDMETLIVLKSQGKTYWGTPIAHFSESLVRLLRLASAYITGHVATS